MVVLQFHQFMRQFRVALVFLSSKSKSSLLFVDVHLRSFSFLNV